MRIPIRSKLAGALLLPLLALMVVAFYEIGRADESADDAASEEALATAAVGPSSLISQLQNERNFAGVDQLGMTAALELPVASYEEARTNTDQAVVALQQFVADRGEDLGGAFDAGLAAVGAELATLRADIDASTLPKGLGNQPFADELFTRYSSIIEVLLDDTTGIALRIDDADLRTGVELVGLTTQAYEIGSHVVRGILLNVITGRSDAIARLEVGRLNAVNDRLDEEMLTRSEGPYEGIPEEHLLNPDQQAQDALLKQFENEGTANITELTAGINATEEAGTLALRHDVALVLEQEAADVVDDAQAQKQLVVVLAIAAVGAALVITVLASRSITNPLRSLTRQARAMATDRLPSAVQRVLDTPLGDDVVVPDVAPIAVRTRDEVADVAAALNTVQGSALDLAVEQAVLRRNIADSFVNMGRRNQNLLDRQLDFITDLERQEQEPERLEGLFRLDHLATRMRRNAESLLRLAGGSSDTGGGWSGPVPMVDVVRGALGEVEDYQRVDVRALQSATVSGSAGADLAHALAELVENALSFSPPHERVEIRGRRGDNGGYILAVIDQGVGMTDEQLDVANRRLAGRESFTVAPSRYLGHYVAGYLAANHGIKIELRSTAAGGITARLDIPAALLVGDTGYAARPAEAASSSIDTAEPPVEPSYEPSSYEPPSYEPSSHEPSSYEPSSHEPSSFELPSYEQEPIGRSEPFEPFESLPPIEAAPTVVPVEPVAPLPPLAPAEPVARYEPPSPSPAPPAPVERVEPPAPVAPGDAAPAALPRRGTDPVPVGTPGNGATTPGGLTRRVRGANAPTATNVAAAFGGASAAGPQASGPAPVPAPMPTPMSTSSADDVASFLSAFSGGVERGLSEAQREEEDQ